MLALLNDGLDGQGSEYKKFEYFDGCSEHVKIQKQKEGNCELRLRLSFALIADADVMIPQWDTKRPDDVSEHDNGTAKQNLV